MSKQGIERYYDEPIIKSILDNDFYKGSMGQMIFNQFPEAVVSSGFTNRGGTSFPPSFLPILKRQIEMMADLRMTPEEAVFAKRIRFMKPTYLEWLYNYRYNPEEVSIWHAPFVHGQYDGRLQMRIHGPWYRQTYWEVPLMAIISELNFAAAEKAPDWEERIVRKAEKMSAAGVNWIDFGTRRRFSFETQDAVVRLQKGFKGFRGTSNMFMAMKHGVKQQGTIAHEVHMVMQAKYGVRMSNSMTLEHWVREYGGDLGIMLPDTLTTDYFLKHLSRRDAKLWDGARLDSGNLVEAGNKVIRKYVELDVDPMSKVLVPSDSLTDDTAIAFHRQFEGHVKGCTAGIGTFGTCDVGVKPLNMVIKVTDADFGDGPVEVVKLSDEPGKYTGPAERITQVKAEIGMRD